MPTEIVLLKTPVNSLAPAGDDDADLLSKLKVGQPVRCTVAKMNQRNYRFHKKYFALLQMAFDMWSETVPPVEYKGQPVKPTFDRFRKDVAILSGFYTATYNVRGEVRLEAKSIKFSQMEEEEFEKLYSATIDLILQKILTRVRMSPDELREAVDHVMNFA